MTASEHTLEAFKRNLAVTLDKMATGSSVKASDEPGHIRCPPSTPLAHKDASHVMLAAIMMESISNA